MTLNQLKYIVELSKDSSINEGCQKTVHFETKPDCIFEVVRTGSWIRNFLANKERHISYRQGT